MIECYYKGELFVNLTATSEIPKGGMVMTKRWVLNFLFAALGALALLFALNLAGYGPALVSHESVRVVLPRIAGQAQPVQPARRPAAPKPQVAPATPVVAPTPAPPAPAVAEPPVTIYNYNIQGSGSSPAPTPQAQPQPTPIPDPVVQPQMQSPVTPCSEADNFFCGPVPPPPTFNPLPTPTPREPIQAPFAPVPGRNIGSAGGFTLQFNVFANGNGGWKNNSHRYGYMPTYGRAPGHVVRVCEQRSNGMICFNRFVAQGQHPVYYGYYNH